MMILSLRSLTISRAALLAPVRALNTRRQIPVRYFSTTDTRSQDGKRERVVVLGSGWAGYAFSRTLDREKYECFVISPRSYFVFTPLLASTAVGTLEFRTTLESVRRLRGVQFRQGWADDVDFAKKVVKIEENRREDQTSQTILPPAPKEGTKNELPVEPPQIPKGPITELSYDKLVIAVGAYSQTFGIEGVRQHAHFLRDIGDARKIRLKVLSLFEQCTSPTMSDEYCKKLLHFAVVGGGPTGIEFAAELHDLIHDDLSKIYPKLMPHVSITVYDIAPKILPMFDQTLANYAMGLFQRNKISVKTDHHIERIRPSETYDHTGSSGLRLRIKEYGDDEVHAGMVVWSTGLMQNPLVEKLMHKSLAAPLPIEGMEAPHEYRLQKDTKTGGVIVDDRFRARLHDAASTTFRDDDNIAAEPQSSSANGRTKEPNSSLQTQILNDVFVIGDCAVIDAQPTLPKTAQVASQEAAHLAGALNRGNLADKPFKYSNWGTLTYLGNWKAIHQGNADSLKGWAAWILWRTAYLTRSMSLKNKVLVPVYWFVSWVFGRDISRF